MTDLGPLFVETTAVADRVFGVPETQEALGEICEFRPLIASNYVRGEFCRTFYRDAVRCHAIMVNSLERKDSLRAALQRIPRDAEVRFRERRLRRSWDIIAYLHDQQFDSVTDAIDSLENLILYDLPESFKSISFVDEGAKCPHGDDPKSTPPSATHEYYRFSIAADCTQRDREFCEIDTFILRHINQVESLSEIDVASFPRSVQRELSKLVTAAKKLLSSKKPPSSRRKSISAAGELCRVHLADFLIVLSCPADVPIVTSNSSHFEAICEALSRPKPMCYK